MKIHLSETEFLKAELKRLQDDMQALSAPVQEPVAILKGIDEYGPVVDWYRHWVTTPIGTKFYTTPPAAQRQWVGLTDEDFIDLCEEASNFGTGGLIRHIEAKLKEKNT
jgi:hypothetical protein